MSGRAQVLWEVILFSVASLRQFSFRAATCSRRISNGVGVDHFATTRLQVQLRCNHTGHNNVSWVCKLHWPAEKSQSKVYLAGVQSTHWGAGALSPKYGPAQVYKLECSKHRLRF